MALNVLISFNRFLPNYFSLNQFSKYGCNFTAKWENSVVHLFQVVKTAMKTF